jgi:hypothetical protein
MQPTYRTIKRRTKSSDDGAFSFWFRRPYADQHVGAWMLSKSEASASFLTSADHAPKVGETLELTEPCDSSDASAPIPKVGRVVGLDNSHGGAQRVDISFD